MNDLAEAIAASPVSLWCLLDYQLMAQLMPEEAVNEALKGHSVIPSATGGPDDVDLVAKVVEPAGATMLGAKIVFFPAQVGGDGAELLLSCSVQAFAHPGAESGHRAVDEAGVQGASRGGVQAVAASVPVDRSADQFGSPVHGPGA